MNAAPKTLLYRDAVRDVEARIVEALPDILDKLIAQAKEGDIRSATYLLDRVLGRAAGLKTAPVEDRRLPYTQQDAEQSARLARLLGGFGEGTGA